MQNDQNHLQVGLQLKDYRLLEKLHQEKITQTWKAQQISILREVLIEVLNPSLQHDSEVTAQFLTRVQAKAKIDHPLIASIYEAIQEEDICFYTKESLQGSTLQQFVNEENPLQPSTVLSILHHIAEANMYLEEHGIAFSPIELNNIFISEQNHCRIENLAIENARDYALSVQDQCTIATALTPLLQENLPGSTRTHSLLNHMLDSSKETHITWEQVYSLSRETQKYITEHSLKASQKFQPEPIQKQKRYFVPMVVVAVLLFTIASVFFLMRWVKNQPKLPATRDLSQMVTIPTESHQTPQGAIDSTESFWIDAHEVTIAEYASFLEKISILNEEQLAAYQHEQQPASKTSHLPDDWENLYAAATQGSTWNNMPMNPNNPVIGVDWWDAYTFASFSKRRLPSQTEWNTIVTYTSKTQAPPASDWGAVDQTSKDITIHRIYGLSGNVAEWTADKSKDPASPTQKAMPVIVGGSYLKKDSNALSKEWLDPTKLNLEDARNLRRKDLGFRTVSDKQPLK